MKKRTAVKCYANHVVIYSYDSDADEGIFAYPREDILGINAGLVESGSYGLALNIRNRAKDNEVDELLLTQDQCLSVLSWWVGATVPPLEIAALEGAAYTAALEHYQAEKDK